MRRAFRSAGFTLERTAAQPAVQADAGPFGEVYDEDNLRSLHNHDFVSDPEFVRAYARGIQAAGTDYNWRWRVHIGLWAAQTAARLPGDFVECGVNRGFLSSAIMELLDWDSLGKTFYLLDTFAGIDAAILPDEERVHAEAANVVGRSGGFYVQSSELVRRNFAQWRNARIIEGSVPGTLDGIDASEIAFLHLDMNSSTPEVEALEFLWPRLVQGGIVLFDDFGYVGGAVFQHGPIARSVRGLGATIATLPTGQGLLLKPPH